MREALTPSGLVFHRSLFNWSSYHREVNRSRITSTSLNDMLATDTEDSPFSSNESNASQWLSFTCLTRGLLIARESAAEC